MKLFVTDLEGVEHELEGLDGWRVMEIIRDYGLPMKAECGGRACAERVTSMYHQNGKTSFTQKRR